MLNLIIIVYVLQKQEINWNTKISLQEKMHNNFIEIQIKSSRNGAQFVPIGML